MDPTGYRPPSPPAPATAPLSVPSYWQGRCPDVQEPQQTCVRYQPVPKGAAPDPLWFEKAMSKPLFDVSSRLLPDRDIKSTLQHPQDSLTFYRTEVARRKEMEDAGEEYTFAPFLPTLRNMVKVTQNIVDGQQFPEPLTDDDRQQFQKLQGHIQKLIEDKAPYKRTVRMALLMSCMLEIATVRYAFPALRKSAPRLFVETPTCTKRLRGFQFKCFDSDSGHFTRLKTEEMSLAMVLSCHWGGLNPQGPDENTQLFDCWMAGSCSLKQWLEDPGLLVYPSFEPLDLQDFCQFSHLPVYPLGMMAAHAINADAAMMTPMKFFQHDINHACGTQPLERLTDSDHPLDGPENRLRFRQLVLDNTHPIVKEQQLEPALAFVFFYLIHETPPVLAKEELAADSVLLLLRSVNSVRKRDHAGYPDRYRRISDWQAVLACLWVHRLARRWQQGDRTLPLDKDFFQSDLRCLVDHWNFLSRHRHTLTASFCSRARVYKNQNSGRCDDCESRSYDYKSQSPYAAVYGGTLMLKNDHDPDADGPVDNTDLVYFDELLHRLGRQRIAKAVGEDPPPGYL